MSAALRGLAATLAIAGLAVAMPSAAGESLAGHYFLQGIHETGSELRLREDGRYDWFMAYGAMDATSAGRWSRESDRVVLIADLPAKDAPLFRVDAAFPWDDTTEARLRDLEAERDGALAEERCPFLAVADFASAAPAFGEEKPPQAELERAARDALAALQNARDVFEAAAEGAVKIRAHVVAVQGDDALRRDADDAMRLAVAAMDAYRANRAQARDAHHAAGLPLPTLPEPRIPIECGVVPSTTPDDAAKGLGVVVGDPAGGLRFAEIEAVFEFSDGHRETRTTNRGGWALIRPRDGASLRRVTLSIARDMRESVGLDETVASAAFAFDPAKGDVLAIVLDSARLASPMFERLELRVEDGALIPTWSNGEERGRYVRE
ncbi:MAG: hypothetical protein ACOY82_12880 [Pseudomonadota bacterium]